MILFGWNMSWVFPTTVVELIQELYGIEWEDKDGIFGGSFSCGDVAASAREES